MVPFKPHPIVESNGDFVYDAVAVLGSGKYAQVLRAKRRTDGQLFAVKTFDLTKLKKIPDGEAREMNILKSLAHPNVMNILATHQSSSYIHTVMPLAQYGNLKSLLKSRGGTLIEVEMRSIVKGCLDGLAYLEKSMLIHRDIRPANILLNGKLQPILCNFGCATSLKKTMEFSGLCGALEYMAPEMVMYDKYGSHVDVWSLGCVAFRCLVGWTTMMQQQNEHLKKPSAMKERMTSMEITMPAMMSLQGKALLQRMLEFDPHKRVTATVAVGDEYFWTDTPSELPKSCFRKPFDLEMYRASKRPVHLPNNDPETEMTKEPSALIHIDRTEINTEKTSDEESEPPKKIRVCACNPLIRCVHVSDESHASKPAVFLPKNNTVCMKAVEDQVDGRRFKKIRVCECNPNILCVHVRNS